MMRWVGCLSMSAVYARPPVRSVKRPLFFALLALVSLWSAGVLAQEPPPAEPSAPVSAEGQPVGAEAGGQAPQVVGPGTASGPPPLGNEAPPDGAPSPGGPGSGDAPPAVGLANTPDAPRPSTATFPSGGAALDDDEPYLYMGLGLGLLFLVGLGFVWSRGRAPAGLNLPEGVVRVAEPALIAPPVPSLSDGLHAWTVETDHHDALLTDLLTTLADAHRVLVVAPAEVTLPRVAGGPVFRVDGLRPVHIEEPAEVMADDGGRTPVVLLVLPPDQAGALAGFADALPPGVGGVGLCTHAPEVALPIVQATATDGGWSLSRGDHAVSVIRTSDGRLVEDLGQAGA